MSFYLTQSIQFQDHTITSGKLNFQQHGADCILKVTDQSLTNATYQKLNIKYFYLGLGYNKSHTHSDNVFIDCAYKKIQKN